MCMKSWKAEFYPVRAYNFTPQNGVQLTSDVELLEHSLKKWEGLTPENLAKHGCSVHPDQWYKIGDELGFKDEDEPGHRMFLGSDSCSLCVARINHQGTEEERCVRCPISLFTGRACDADALMAPPNSSPYAMFGKNKDPQPMIELLRNTLEWAKNMEPVAQIVTEMREKLEELGYVPVQGYPYGFTLRQRLGSLELVSLDVEIGELPDRTTVSVSYEFMAADQEKHLQSRGFSVGERLTTEIKEDLVEKLQYYGFKTLVESDSE